MIDMIDPFLLLAPLYLLGVMLLLGFVGCAQILGLEEPTVFIPDPPQNLVASPGDGHIEVSWQTHPMVNEYHLLRGDTSGTVPADYPLQRVIHTNQIPFTDTVVNGRTYFYRVTALSEDGFETAPSNEASATPAWPHGAFVNSFTPGSVKPGLNGFYGMAIEVGAEEFTIQTLGRAFGAGLAGVHELRLIDAAMNLERGHAIVDMNSPADGPFKYGPLIPAPFTVSAHGIYYIVSEEFAGGDALYNRNTIVDTRMEAKVTSAVSSVSEGVYDIAGNANQAFGPVSFQY
ncbi:MAG TPA: hypothetical protein VM099_14585 [Gemmatimonadaceae bacterium]|nr:hypothetical protein [Gemmatimonadaceae bacterium]